MREGSPLALNLTPYLLLAAAVFVAYANIYGNGFIADDDVLIVRNPLLRSWGHWPTLFTKTIAPGCPYYRPLTGLLHMIVFHAAGLSRAAFHLPNVVLHAANAGLVYALGRKLGFAPVPVFLAALLWALHPIQVESVTQISGIADVLYSFFCLLGVIILFPDFSRRRFLLAVPLMACGLLSKEAAIVFPLLALSCMLYYQNGKRFGFRAWLRAWPLVLTGALYAAAWLAVLFSIFQPAYVSVGHEQPHAFNYSVFATPVYYLKMLLWPVGLHMEHDLPVYGDMWHGDVLAGIVLILLAAAQVLRPQSRRSLPLSWGIFWFAAAQAPTAIMVSSPIIYEHWLYLPSAGLMLGAFQSLFLQMKTWQLAQRRLAGRMGVALALMLTPLLGFLTWKQSEIWHDSTAFYDNMLEYGGTAIIARVNIGVMYVTSGAPGKAIEQFRYAVEHADNGTVSRAQLANVHAGWGLALLAMNGTTHEHDEDALDHFHQALDTDPDCFAALEALARIYLGRGDAVQAAIYHDKAIAARKKTAGWFDSASNPP